MKSWELDIIDQRADKRIIRTQLSYDKNFLYAYYTILKLTGMKKPYLKTW